MSFILLYNSVTKPLLAYWLEMSSFSLFCSTSVHDPVLRGQQFIHHPHRLEPHLRAERAPEGVRADRERAAHLQRLRHRALLAKDLWQKSVSYRFLSASVCWAKLKVVYAELFLKNCPLQSQAKTKGAYRHAKIYLSKSLKKKSIELSFLSNIIPDWVRLIWFSVRVKLSQILELCCNSILQGYSQGNV